jgi:hypothetical protein
LGRCFRCFFPRAPSCQFASRAPTRINDISAYDIAQQQKKRSEARGREAGQGESGRLFFFPPLQVPLFPPLSRSRQANQSLASKQFARVLSPPAAAAAAPSRFLSSFASAIEDSVKLSETEAKGQILRQKALQKALPRGRGSKESEAARKKGGYDCSFASSRRAGSSSA